MRLRHHAELIPPYDGAVMVTAAPGPEGEMVVLWASKENADAISARTVQPGGASFPEARTAAPVSVHFATYRPHLVMTVPIAEQSLAHTYVQPLPRGDVLLVGARCRLRDGAAEPNAAIYTVDGELVREGVLGDGIEDVQTTPSGEIWVSYFDEGVVGNFGWGVPGGLDPIGQPGLIRFTPDLGIAWRYPYNNKFGVITDCYALNVTGEEAWACYYTDFPIVRVRAGTITGWANEVKGAHALVVADGSAVLIGGYGEDRHRVVAGTIEGEAFSPHRHARLVMPDGRSIPQDAAVMGRGSELHVVAGHSWLKLDLKALTTG
ncbi:hypothetical protein GCM10009555_074000 [Acrocarpospora macrocephala]|uniref:Glucose/Sorbosone dehydrogenase domain-containing protein n=1 Tax=Acrocarpospora macrocephala TaxID=150177 RepID=A0A5M3WT80_9ACTN|nr:hypothetical protein Amac_050390 [Acrocarpospora macrocephala]